jgi:hypothetical protein
MQGLIPSIKSDLIYLPTNRCCKGSQSYNKHRQSNFRQSSILDIIQVGLKYGPVNLSSPVDNLADYLLQIVSFLCGLDYFRQVAAHEADCQAEGEESRGHHLEQDCQAHRERKVV